MLNFRDLLVSILGYFLLFYSEINYLKFSKLVNLFSKIFCGNKHIKFIREVCNYPNHKLGSYFYAKIELIKLGRLNLSLEGVDLESKFNLPIQTTTFPSDGSILVTYADSSTLRTVFNSDGSISYVYTKGTEVTERKIVFNSDGSISVVDVPQTQGGE